MSIEKLNDDNNEAKLSRRGMLVKLGIAATAAYAAPVLLRLGEAHASSFSRSRASFSGPRRPRTRRSFS